MTKAADKNTDDWIALMPHITHDFRTPLVSTRLEAQTLEKWFPELLKGYSLAVEHQLMEGSISKRQLSMREKYGDGIKDNMTKLLGFLEVLDEGTSALNLNLSNVESRSIQSYLDHLLAQYPFESETDRRGIQLKVDPDFNVGCPSFFIEPMLFQILSIVYETKKAADNKGDITLLAETEGTDNRLHIKTSSPGLSESQLSYFFDCFTSKQEDHYVPGLGFCRLALRQLGGDIVSTVIEGEYTDFVVIFPR